MIKIKKKSKVILLCISLIGLFVLLFTVNGDIKSLEKTKIVANASNKYTVSKNDEGNDKDNYNDIVIEEVNVSNENTIVEEVSTEEVVEEVKEEIVYDGLTMGELSSKLERNMKNELSGYGSLYASYSLEKGVDPYLALAISLEETGCNFNCSNLVKSCNNVGGMKGYGCGAYGYFDSLDLGIRAFIDNIYIKIMLPMVYILLMR